MFNRPGAGSNGQLSPLGGLKGLFAKKGASTAASQPSPGSPSAASPASGRSAPPLRGAGGAEDAGLQALFALARRHLSDLGSATQVRGSAALNAMHAQLNGAS
jgi:hypothetical protein